MKLEHQMVLQSIEKALELVENKTPERITQTLRNSSTSSSPLRLREKINSVLVSGSGNNVSSSPSTPKLFLNRPNIASSPLSPSVEKSHITFDILNELETQSAPPPKRKFVHFKENSEIETDGRNELSMASREYLKKYGLI